MGWGHVHDKTRTPVWRLVLDVFNAHPDWSSKQIGEAAGCHDAYVRTVMKRKGKKLARSFVKRTCPAKPNSGPSRRVLQDWERQACLDAYRDGEKLEPVAAEFGVTIWAISKLARRAGEPPRVNGRRK